MVIHSYIQHLMAISIYEVEANLETFSTQLNGVVDTLDAAGLRLDVAHSSNIIFCHLEKKNALSETDNLENHLEIVICAVCD